MFMRITALVCLVLVLGASLGGCKQRPRAMKQMTREVASGRQALAEHVTILGQDQGNDPGLTDFGIHLIRNRADLDALGAKTMGDPHIDFANEDVVLLCLGEQPTGGYWTRVTAVQLEGDELHVEGIANAPGPSEVVAQVFTYPYSVVKIPKTGATEVYQHIRSVTGEQAPK